MKIASAILSKVYSKESWGTDLTGAKPVRSPILTATLLGLLLLREQLPPLAFVGLVLLLGGLVVLIRPSAR
jgi:drug/metabolite transporter (DMT)-like permease